MKAPIEKTGRREESDAIYNMNGMEWEQLREKTWKVFIRRETFAGEVLSCPCYYCVSRLPNERMVWNGETTGIFYTTLL